MKCMVSIVGAVMVLAAPAAAQWLGMPAWTSPKGGTGVSFYGDYGAPSDSSGGGNAFGGRASLGLGTITLTAGVASWKAANQNARATSYGGTAAFRLIGGSLIPVSVNLQLGAAHNAQNTSVLVLAIALSGCALTLDATHLGVPVSLASSAQGPDSGTPFNITKHSIYLLVGLVPVSRPNLEDVLAGQMGTGARITNLRVKVRSRWSDLLVTGLTLGFVVPRSVTFEGVVAGK